MSLQQNNMESRKIGALWGKEGKKGKFWSGELTINGQKVQIVAFPREKRSDREPDIDILKSIPREGLKI